MRLLFAEDEKSLSRAITAILKKNLRKLTSILLDNALKYSDENGFIQLNLEKKANISNCLS